MANKFPSGWTDTRAIYARDFDTGDVILPNGGRISAMQFMNMPDDMKRALEKEIALANGRVAQANRPSGPIQNMLPMYAPGATGRIVIEKPEPAAPEVPRKPKMPELDL